MYRKLLHLVDNVDWPVCKAMEGNRFEQEPENFEEMEVNRMLMLLVAQLDGHPEEIEVNRRQMLLVAQLDGHYEEIGVNRMLMLLADKLDGHYEEIGVNRWQMLFLLPAYGGEPDANAVALLCKVCLLNPINRVLNCGHPFCDGCTNRLPLQSPCPICRTPIEVVQIFFLP